MGRIITFGEIMLRLATNGFYRFFQNDQLQATFGGAEANVAASLANFGESVSFVTKLPSNAIGKGAISSLRSFGIDTSKIIYGGKRLGIYYLEKGSNQRGSMCIYDREGSSFAESKRKDFDWGKIFFDADWFHFTGITPALSREVFFTCKDACISASRKEITISCDLNYRSKLWSREEARVAMSELLPYVDVCIANEEDAKDVLGIAAENTNAYKGEINREGYTEVAKKIVQKYGVKYIAFTLRKSHSATSNGWTGMLCNGDRCFYAKEYHISNIVDRIGGGDSFGAGLIYGFRKDFDYQKIIEFAVASSALKHSIEGDFNRVDVSEVEKLMFGDASGRVQR